MKIAHVVTLLISISSLGYIFNCQMETHNRIKYMLKADIAKCEARLAKLGTDHPEYGMENAWYESSRVSLRSFWF